MSDQADPGPGDGSLSGEARAATRGVLALSLLQTLGRAFGLSFALGATRLLVPAELGRYSTVSGIVLFGGFIADFGTSLAITRRVSADPDTTDHLLGGTLGMSLAIGLLSYAAVVAFAIVAGYPQATTVDIAIGAIALPISALATSLLAALDGHGLLDRRAVITFVQSGVVALGGLATLWAGWGVRSAVAFIPAGPLVALVMAAWVLRRSAAWRSRPGLDFQASRDLLLEALPYAVLAGIAAFTLRFDLVFVSVVSTAAETARYDLALRSVEAVTYLGTVIAAPVIFILSRRLVRTDTVGAQRALGQAARFAYVVGLPLSVLLAAVATPAVHLLYGADYANVAGPLAVLAGQIWLNLLVSLLGSAVIAAGLGRPIIPISAGVAVSGVVMDLVLVPPMGATGAAWAAVGAQIVAIVGFSMFVRRRIGLWVTLPRTSVVVATIAGGSTAWALQRSMGVAAAVIGGLVYGVLLVTFRGVGRADLALLRAAVRGGVTKAMPGA
jgi:O-antigen/teichoic acid export membrane protein